MARRPPDRPLRVVLGEDDVLLRAGIGRLLEDAGVEVVGQAGDADDLLRKALAHRPDVAVIDVQMPPRREDDGLLAGIELRRRLPDMGVVVLSKYSDPAYATQLIGDDATGVGYLLKERVGDVESFVAALERVASGGSALDPEVVQRMLARSQHDDDDLGDLTDRERAVLATMAEGKSNRGIADALAVSDATVEKHVTAIMRKLGVDSATSEHRRVHAVLRYLQHKDAV